MPWQRIPKRIVLFLSLAGCALAPRAAEDFSAWAHSAKLHINTTASGADVRKTMTDIPLLVRITDARIFSQSASDGSDLRFASETGSALAFQIERWDPARGKAEVWVRLPRIDSSSDKQWMGVYWGKPGAPWLSDGSKVFLRSAGYYGVYHLGEGGTQARTNAAGNWNHATPKNYDGDERVEGVIGMADSLDGAGMGADYLDLGKGFDSLQSFSFNVWANPVSGGAGDPILDLGNGNFKDEVTFGRVYNSDSLAAMFFTGGGYTGGGFGGGFGGFGSGGYGSMPEVAAAGAFVTGKWAFYGMSVQGKSVTLFKNGAQIASGTLAQEAATVLRTTNFLGHSSSGWSDFAGKLDEPEFSFVGRSAQWMKLAYEAQRPDGKLLSWEFPAEVKLSITTQPAGLTVAEGGAFALSVVAAGSGVIQYQWLKDGTPVGGATGRVFQVPAATLADAGLYACRLTDGKDTVLSKSAAVIVPENLSSWAHSRTITADPRNAGVTLSADVAAVPVLLRLGRGSFDFTQAAADGRDLRFAAADGAPLAYGIERWAADTAEVWVRLPSVAAAGATSFTLYWGKSAAHAASSPASVFSINDNWRAYYAFSETVPASGTARAGDATLNGFDADGSGLADLSEGAIGRAFAFAASAASHASVPQAALAGLNGFTLLAWVREPAGSQTGAAGQDRQVFGTGYALSGQGRFGVAVKDGALEAWSGDILSGGANMTGGPRVDDGSWHLIAATAAAGSDLAVYADGAAALTLAAPVFPLGGYPVGLGGALAADGSWNAGFTGDLDAVQILGEAKSADWIKLAYAAQRPGSALLAFQAPVDAAPPAPVIDPPGGAFSASVVVALSCPADSVRLFYTLDGTAPDTAVRGATHAYSSPFLLSADAEVRALAYRKGQAGPAARASFRIAALAAGGDTLVSGDSLAVDGLRRIVYPRQDATSPVLVRPGPDWHPAPAGFDRVGPLFQARPLDSASVFPGLSLAGDSLAGLSLFRRDGNGAILWMPPKDGKLWIPAAGTYFWGRDTLPPRIRVASSVPVGNDSLKVAIVVEDNVAAVQARVRFGRSPTDSLGWWTAPSGQPLEFTLPVPSDPSAPLEANFTATDQSRRTDLPAGGFLTLPRPVPSLAAPVGLRAGIRWKMAGMPLAPGLSLSLKDLAARSGTGPLYAAVWMGRTPPDSGYKILRGGDTLPGGKGFWIASDGEAPTLAFPPARAVASDTDGSFAIRLDSGWNLITCPALRPLAWPVSVRDGDAYLRSPLKPLYAYEDTGYARPDSLLPWHAYYVRYEKDTVVHVGPGAARAAARLAAKPAAEAPLRLGLSADGVRLRLGAAWAARTGLGVEDEGQPPPFAAKSAAWLSREGRALGVDYVAWEPDRAMAWTVALRSQPDGGGVAVAEAALPPGLEAWAVSPARRLKWPLSPGSNIPVTGDDTLLVYAGTPAALARVPDLQRGRTAAGAFAAGVRAGARGLELIVDLPSEANVSARILDARGRVLGDLPERALSPGRHALAWSAFAGAPLALPPGAYWLELRAKGPTWTRRQVCPAGWLR